MHLDSLIHGLFITQTQFRLSTTFIPGNYYLHTYNWQSFKHLHTIIMYTFRLNTCGAFPLLIPLCSPFLVPFTYLETLLAVTGSCPPRSQVACKLTPPFSTLPLPSPLQIPSTQLIWALLWRLQDSGFSCPEQDWLPFSNSRLFMHFGQGEGSLDQHIKYGFLLFFIFCIADFVFSSKKKSKKSLVRGIFVLKVGQYRGKISRILCGFQIWRKILDKTPEI